MKKKHSKKKDSSLKKSSSLIEFINFRLVFIVVGTVIVAFLALIGIPLVNKVIAPINQDYILDDKKLSEYKNGDDLITDLTNNTDKQLTSVYGQVSANEINEADILK